MDHKEHADGMKRRIRYHIPSDTGLKHGRLRNAITVTRRILNRYSEQPNAFFMRF